MDKVKYGLAKIIETMTQELMGYWHKMTDWENNTKTYLAAQSIFKFNEENKELQKELDEILETLWRSIGLSYNKAISQLGKKFEEI